MPFEKLHKKLPKSTLILGAMPPEQKRSSFKNKKEGDVLFLLSRDARVAISNVGITPPLTDNLRIFISTHPANWRELLMNTEGGSEGIVLEIEKAAFDMNILVR